MTCSSKLMVLLKTAPMFYALNVGSTVASPTVIESNGGLGLCLACRTRSPALSLFKSIHLFSSHKQTSTLVCADTTSSMLVVFMLCYTWASSITINSTQALINILDKFKKKNRKKKITASISNKPPILIQPLAWNSPRALWLCSMVLC